MSSSKGRGKSSNPPRKGSPASRATAYFGVCQLFHLWQSWTPCSSMPKRITVSKGASSGEDKDSRCDDGDRHGHSSSELKGWFEIQDGGASSMVIGHNTLMKVLDHMGERGVKTSRFLFHPRTRSLLWR